MARKAMMETFWKISEAAFRFVAGVHPIAEGEPHLFHVARRRYVGMPFVVDGIEVKPFMRIVELHINNELLFDTLRHEETVVGVAVKLLQGAKRSFPAVAEKIAEAPYDKAHVLLGVTFIHRGVERYGFSTFPIRNYLFRVGTARHLRSVLKTVNPNAETLLLSHPDAFVPKVVAISRERFVSLHHPNASETPVTRGGRVQKAHS